MKLKFIIYGIPKAKQSFRFTKKGLKYKPKDIKEAERNIEMQVRKQLPSGFKVIDEPLKINKLHYIFPVPRSFSKKVHQKIEQGLIVYKQTKPDLTDNLSKTVMDALEGIVFTNDSRIISMDNVKKIYGVAPRIEIEIELLKAKEVA